MSKTWDIMSIERPKKIPSTVLITCEKSVAGISPCESIEKDGELHFVIGPTFFDSPIIERKLTFSYEKNPSLGYEYTYVGEIGPSQLKGEGERIFLLLEK